MLFTLNILFPPGKFHLQFKCTRPAFSISFCNSLIIHQFETMEIITVTVSGYQILFSIDACECISCISFGLV